MSNRKCSCYHKKLDVRWTKGANYHMNYVGVCWGTKEREPCSCEGDERKCDFYPEKREQKCDVPVAETNNVLKVKIVAVSYKQSRLEFFKNQLASARRKLDWAVKHNPDPYVPLEKGEIVSFYEWAVKKAEEEIKNE